MGIRSWIAVNTQWQSIWPMKKLHSAINSRMFKRFNHFTDQLYELQLVKSEIKHRKPIILGFIILQDAKLRKLELYYNFFKKFCDTDKFEELEMDSFYSFYVALSGEILEDVILCEKRAERNQFRSKDCTDSFTANATDKFSPDIAAMSTRNMIRENQVSSKKSIDVQKCCVFVGKHIVIMINKLTSTSLAAIVTIKEHWKSVAMMDQCQSIAKC